MRFHSLESFCQVLFGHLMFECEIRTAGKGNITITFLLLKLGKGRTVVAGKTVQVVLLCLCLSTHPQPPIMGSPDEWLWDRHTRNRTVCLFSPS